MCNSKIFLTSVLVLVVSRQPAGVCCSGGRSTFYMLQNQQNRKQRINRCRNHARNFCVWIHRHAITKIRNITRMSTRRVERLAASRATTSRLKRFSSAGTAIVSFAHCHMEGIIATIAPFACIPVTWMIGSQGIG